AVGSLDAARRELLDVAGGLRRLEVAEPLGGLLHALHPGQHRRVERGGSGVGRMVGGGLGRGGAGGSHQAARQQAQGRKQTAHEVLLGGRPADRWRDNGRCAGNIRKESRPPPYGGDGRAVAAARRLGGKWVVGPAHRSPLTAYRLPLPAPRLPLPSPPPPSPPPPRPAPPPSGSRARPLPCTSSGPGGTGRSRSDRRRW